MIWNTWPIFIMFGFIFIECNSIDVIIKVDHFLYVANNQCFLNTYLFFITLFYYNFSKNKSFTFNIYNCFNKRGYTFKFFVFNIFNKNVSFYCFLFQSWLRQSHSFFGISLCPYGNVFISSSKIYCLSSKVGKDILFFS